MLPKCVSLGSAVQEKANLQAAMRSALEHPDEKIAPIIVKLGLFRYG